MQRADEPRVCRDVDATRAHAFAHVGAVGHLGEEPRIGTATTSAARAAVVCGLVRVVEARGAVSQDDDNRREVPDEAELVSVAVTRSMDSPSEKPTGLPGSGAACAASTRSVDRRVAGRGASRDLTPSPNRLDARGATTRAMVRKAEIGPTRNDMPGAAAQGARDVRRATFPAEPGVAQVLALRVPAQVGVDRLLVHLMSRRDDDRTMRRGLAVVQALIVDRDAEEAGRAERDVSGVLLLDRAADRLLALVDAEHELRAWPVALRPLREHATRGKRVENAATIGPLVRFMQHLAALDVADTPGIRPRVRRARRRRSRVTCSAVIAAATATCHSSDAASTGRSGANRRHPRSQTRPVGVDGQARGMRARSRGVRAAVARPGSRRATLVGRRDGLRDGARAGRTSRPSPATPAPWRRGTARRRRRAHPGPPAMVRMTSRAVDAGPRTPARMSCSAPRQSRGADAPSA